VVEITRLRFPSDEGGSIDGEYSPAWGARRREKAIAGTAGFDRDKAISGIG
jgi:hypothetical protein